MTLILFRLKPLTCVYCTIAEEATECAHASGTDYDVSILSPLS